MSQRHEASEVIYHKWPVTSRVTMVAHMIVPSGDYEVHCICGHRTRPHNLLPMAIDDYVRHVLDALTAP